mgnify:CR=1 FL=1
MKKADLTKKQLEVVTDIFNGGVFVCDKYTPGAWVSGMPEKEDYHIDNGVFFRLVNKGAIWQQLSRPFNYVLSRECRGLLRNQLNTKTNDDGNL